MTYDDYEPMNDYEDQMDGLQLGIYKYDDLHCRHGTFVGNWAGPDYMCGYCEMGVTDEEYAAGIAWNERRQRRKHALKPKLVEIINQVNAEARKPDRNEAEVMRLVKRLAKYINWNIEPPMRIAEMIETEAK